LIFLMFLDSGATVAPGSVATSRGKAVPSATVLITEDEPVIRAFARLVLQEAGYQSLEAASVEEALALLQSERALDVLFTDINLRSSPRGGLELAREAVGLRPDLRVIYTTGKILTDEMRATFVDGAAFLGKPYTPHALAEALASILNGRHVSGSKP
jgi:CheY-like chemotaxis protein